MKSWMGRIPWDFQHWHCHCAVASSSIRQSILQVARLDILPDNLKWLASLPLSQAWLFISFPLSSFLSVQVRSLLLLEPCELVDNRLFPKTKLPTPVLEQQSRFVL